MLSDRVYVESYVSVVTLIELEWVGLEMYRDWNYSMLS